MNWTDFTISEEINQAAGSAEIIIAPGFITQKSNTQSIYLKDGHGNIVATDGKRVVVGQTRQSNLNQTTWADSPIDYGTCLFIESYAPPDYNRTILFCGLVEDWATNSTKTVIVRLLSLGARAAQELAAEMLFPTIDHIPQVAVNDGMAVKVSRFDKFIFRGQNPIQVMYWLMYFNPYLRIDPDLNYIDSSGVSQTGSFFNVPPDLNIAAFLELENQTLAIC